MVDFTLLSASSALKLSKEHTFAQDTVFQEALLHLEFTLKKADQFVPTSHLQKVIESANNYLNS